MARLRLLLHLILLALAAVVLRAQTSSVVVQVNVPVVSQNQPLPVGVEFTPTANVERVLFKYRSFGDSEFREQEMLKAGNTATLTISAQYVLPPHIEYYIQVFLTNGQSATYPLQNAELNPLKATVRPVDPKNLEVRLLSPEQGETVAAEDLVIAVSLFYASDNVNRRATKLFLNGVDVTPQAVFSDDVILFSPANVGMPLTLGVQFLRIELYDHAGSRYHTVESNFNLSTASAILAQETALRAGIEGQAEYRREDIASEVSTFIRGQLRLNGTYRSLGFGANALMTNEEKPDRQPQNRFLAHGDLGWLKLQLGDAFPKFPSYIVSGKRVRGITGNLALGFFNVDVSYGEVAREIEGIVLRDTTFADSSGLNARPENTVQKSGFTYSLFSPGTFSRDFLAVRPSFGSGENFQWGFTYMKSKDKVGSIKYGIKPQENLVVGSDMVIAFDNQRFRLEGQASLGITNRDISEGSFTDADYDELAGKNDPDLTPEERRDREKTVDDLKKIAKVGEKFITINEYLFPLNPVGTGLPAVAYEGTLTLNYFNNFIRAQMYQRGAAYISFGNEFLQSDIRGIAISDRIRMFSNRALLSLSYESREDNTAESKIVTTQYTNLNGSLTVYPASNLPSFTFGYGVNTRKNDANPRDSLQKLFVADDMTNRINLQIAYDFTLGARQNLTLGMNLSDKKDNTPSKLDQKSNSFYGSLTTIYSFPLQTTISFNSNLTESAILAGALATAGPTALQLQSFDLSTASLNIQYRMMEDQLRLVGNLSSSFGDLNRTLIQAGVDYSITPNHALVVQYDFIQNAGTKDDSIGSLIYRFNF
jgi:hypothetical protein